MGGGIHLAFGRFNEVLPSVSLGSLDRRFLVGFGRSNWIRSVRLSAWFSCLSWVLFGKCLVGSSSSGASFQVLGLQQSEVFIVRLKV